MAVISGKLSPAKDSTKKIEEKREDTRSKLAVLFIAGYLIFLLILLIFTTFYNLKPDIAKDYLIAVGTPLGLIVGSYFNKSNHR